MAVDLAPRGPNESAKEAQERRQAEEVKAWIEVDNVQKAAEAQIAALDNQPGSLTAEQILAREGNEEKVRVAMQKKADIEYLWVHELKCKIKQLFADIDKAVAKERAEGLVAATNRPPEGGEATREQVQDLKAQTLLHATQTLLENKLLPQDLRGGPDQKRAAGLVRPDLAAELPSAEATAELSAYASQIEPIYTRLALGYEAARDMEKGVVVGKAGETLKEAISNPSRLGAGVAALVGLGLLYQVYKDKSPDEGLKKFVMWILGGGALIGGGYMAVRGLDVLNTATGIRMDEPFASPAMKEVREDLAAKMGTKDSGVIDNMIRVYDSPIENYMEAYLSALGSGSDGMEKERLAGNKGLSADEMSDANNQFIKKGANWLSMECYEMALKDGKTPALSDINAQCAAGAQYAKTEFAGLTVGNICIAIDMVKAGVGLKPALSETRITNPHLRELASKVSAFADVLESTDKPDVYLINGYPVCYDCTDGGDHVFTPVLAGGPSLVKVEASLTGDALESTLLRIAEEAEAAARTAYTTAAVGIPSTSKLKYNNKGDWILDPGLDRPPHKGLAADPSDAKVPVVLYYDTSDNTVRIGMDADGDGAPEVRATPYADIAAVAEEYEKNTVLKALIVADTNHVLLSVGPTAKITTITESTGPDQTKIEFQYGSGRVGSVVYENNAVKIITIDTAPDAGLETAWTSVAKTKVEGFFKERVVQEELLRATGKFTNNDFGGWVGKLGELFADGIQWIKDDSIAANFHSNQEQQIIREIQAMLNPYTGMEVKYVNSMFKAAPSPGAAWKGAEYDKGSFDVAEKAFFANELATIKGGMTRLVKPPVEADYILESTQAAIDIANDQGLKAIEAALAPLQYEDPATKASRLQAAIQAGSNLLTGAGSSVRTEWYNQKVKDYRLQLQTAIAALTVIPAGPVPPGTPALTPTQPSRKQVEAEILRVQTDAQHYAVNYWGMTDKDAEKKMMTSRIEGAAHEAEWRPATELVADYLANNLKWENYGFMPNPENMALIMDLWYKNIGMAANAPKNAEEALTYAKNFNFEVWVRFGGARDLSLDRFNGGQNISVVSETEFKDNIAKFNTFAPYNPTTSTALSASPDAPGMESDIIKYKEKRRVEMDRWFAENNDIKVWERLHRWGPDMFKWRDTYVDSYNTRIKDIEAHPSSQTVAGLYKNTEDFKNYLLVEQKIYEAFITGGVVPETEYLGISVPFAVFVSVEVTKDWGKNFWSVPPAVRDSNAYNIEITKKLGDAMDIGRPLPNMPGIPFWA